MKKTWLAVGPGIVHKGDINKLKLAIFRVAENGRAYPMLVRSSELLLNDILFLETNETADYCFLEDFHRTLEGEIDYWVFKESGIPVSKQGSMMDLTQALLHKEFQGGIGEGETLLVSIRQKKSNQANGND